MRIYRFDTEEQMAGAAARLAGQTLIAAIERKNAAAFVAATGMSQVRFLAELTKIQNIDWNKITVFHLDEYINLPEDHPAGFRRYLKEKLINKVNPGKVIFINGNADNPMEECGRLNEIISKYEIDLTMVGIGLTGHLAFNDPPADFQTQAPYHIVSLDELTRKQQVHRESFESIGQAPKEAITMSINQIMKSAKIICLANGAKKTKIVRKSLFGEITPDCPASILQAHPDVHIFLDKSVAVSIKW